MPKKALKLIPIRGKFKNKKYRIKFKLAALKSKSNGKKSETKSKSRKFYNLNSSNQTTILNYFSKIPKTINDKATALKKDAKEKLNKSESIEIQNDPIKTKEVLSNNSELDNCDLNDNSETSDTELLQPLDVQSQKRGKGKITNESLQVTSFRKIPQNRLEDALEMLRNEDHPVWENHNISCNMGIHRYWEPRNCLKSDLKIKYARQFLLRRDWINLSKVLSLSTSNVNMDQNNHYYPLLTKYAILCLAHTDKEQFNEFVQFLAGMDDGNSSSFMEKFTNIIKENEG